MLVFVHIVSEILVGRGSHQPIWIDHLIVWCLILIAFWFYNKFYLMIFLWSIWETFIYIPRVYILNVIYSLSCWTHSFIIYLFQAYNLLAGHFCWTFRTCFFIVIIFPLCLVNAPQLWIYINSYIKIIKLYNEVCFVISVALNSNWVI